MARGNDKKNRKGSTGLNKKESENYLAKNRAKAGVEEFPSGLQMEVLEAGDGGFVMEGDTVEVHQRISLVDGTVIVDSYKNNESEKFLIDEAISGYKEGLLQMHIGGRYKLTLPPELAWGKRGTSKKIGPHAVIIIDCRLIGIV